MELVALPRNFFDRAPALVARDLLGKLLVRRLEGKTLVGRIVETEGYLATGDEASHSHKGKNTRNASMFKDAGHAYVHTLRQYVLLDVVTEGKDTPSAVLIRAVEPVRGITGVADGPGKVGRAMDITRALDGIDMTDPDEDLFIADDKKQLARKVCVSSRIGISKAKDLPLRFYYE